MKKAWIATLASGQELRVAVHGDGPLYTVAVDGHASCGAMYADEENYLETAAQAAVFHGFGLIRKWRDAT